MPTISEAFPAAFLSLLSFRTLFLFIITYFASKVLYQGIYYRFFHPLRGFPGPFWASVTRLWIAYRNVKADEHLVEYELHKKHGKLHYAANSLNTSE